mmetsp:Transcript_41437/g.125454  ORF Transcript_41437/g.125454 Transcript_41437/m.125454 type:complete len:286 (-) Transcript_41437:557-1414(-)
MSSSSWLLSYSISSSSSSGKNGDTMWLFWLSSMAGAEERGGGYCPRFVFVFVGPVAVRRSSSSAAAAAGAGAGTGTGAAAAAVKAERGGLPRLFLAGAGPFPFATFACASASASASRPFVGFFSSTAIVVFSSAFCCAFVFGPFAASISFFAAAAAATVSRVRFSVFTPLPPRLDFSRFMSLLPSPASTFFAFASTSSAFADVGHTLILSASDLLAANNPFATVLYANGSTLPSSNRTDTIVRSFLLTSKRSNKAPLRRDAGLRPVISPTPQILPVRAGRRFVSL